jgi:hypothetical protein
MGILKQAGDLIYTFRFLTLLVTPFENTEAYKAGIIDENGKRLKSFDLDRLENRMKYKDAYTPFHRLVFNVKRLMAKVPGGRSRLASYAAALYLIKEKFSISEKKLLSGLKEMGVDPTDLMVEESQWFLLEDGRLSPGVYKTTIHKVFNSTCEELVYPGDKIMVGEDAHPVGDIFGINIYEATHRRTNQKIYITANEIVR